MHVAILEQSFETVFDWIFAVDSQETKNYVDKIRSTYPSLSRRDLAQKIVDEQSINNGLLGAATGLGSAMALPVIIPFDIIKGWKIQSFMLRCIALVYGYTPQNTDFKTATIALISSGSLEEFKQFVEAEVTTSIGDRAIKSFDSLKQSAIQIAAKKGTKVATKTLTKALSQVMEKKVAKKVLEKSFGVAVPAMGAAIGGSLDWMTTQAMGRLAIEYFENSESAFKL